MVTLITEEYNKLDQMHRVLCEILDLLKENRGHYEHHIPHWTETPAPRLNAHGDERITVALKLERKGQRVEVNEIASIYPKDAARFLDEMKNAKEGGLQEALRYVSDKEKVLDWLGLAPPRGTPSLTDQELSVAKIIQNFNNPTIYLKNVLV